MTDEAISERRKVAERAAALVEPGMRIGLGTGRTAALFIEALGARIAGGLAVPAVVATSKASEAAAKEGGLDVIDMTAGSVPPALDLAIDGADEMDGQLRLIKGGGGSLLREKIVARMAKRFVVIVDHEKQVATLGRYPLPVEIVPFGWAVTAARIGAALDVHPQLRTQAGAPWVTDNGNLIVDCPLKRIDDPDAVAGTLSAIAGVVEHGLFLTEAHEALVGSHDGVREVHRPA
ncbi:MAG: ribose-5-phosphate isomerase RpiA [Pseudomonadota bacterium]